MSRRRRSRRGVPDQDLEAFRRDDSVYSEPVRRQSYTWSGEGIVQPSSRRLPRPFVKSVDYEPATDYLTPVGMVQEPDGAFALRPATPLAPSFVRVSYGPSRQSLRSLLRPTFVGEDNPCASRARRREVIFATGKGGRKLGTKKVRRTSDSERSC